MKQSKKLASLLLALVMMLALSITAFATNGTNNNEGKITINNAVTGQTYTVYQILELESYNTEAGAYAYKATDAWAAFINSSDIKGTYVNVDDQGYVTWVDSADAAVFAALAQAYAKTNNISNQDSKVADSTTVDFTGLNLGYYLVDSTLGSLCFLDTTNPSVTIEEKNQEPTNVKQVEEDSTGELGSVNDADIGQRVKFVSTVTIPVGSEKIVFHDKMSAGLSLVWGTAGVDGTTVYTNAAFTEALPDGNYTLTARDLADGCTFEIDFANYLDLVTEDTTLYIVYYATVNENAVVGGVGNPNESHLSYGENNDITTVPSQTKTYTWSFDVLKYGNNDESKTLEGAKFVLLNKDKSKVAAVANGKLTGWVDVPAAGEDSTITWPANAVLTTDDNGKIEIAGLDADTYYLREITAPYGYNKLAEDVEVKIDPTVSDNGNKLTLAPVTAKVNNNSGTELPSTGGIGTTIFYVVGSALLIGAAVLLIAKKRMNDTK